MAMDAAVLDGILIDAVDELEALYAKYQAAYHDALPALQISCNPPDADYPTEIATARAVIDAIIVAKEAEEANA